MKIVLVVLAAANLVAMVWLCALPRADAVPARVLAVEAGDEPGALALQVEVGRRYRALYERHAAAGGVVRILLLVNAGMLAVGAGRSCVPG